MLNLRRVLPASLLLLTLTLSSCATQQIQATGPLSTAPGGQSPSPSETTPSVQPSTSSPTPSTVESTAVESATPAPVPSTPSATEKPTTKPTASSAPATAPVPPGRVDCAAVACVALTFDDGPNSGTTLQIVDSLTRANAPATFFMLGSMAQSNPGVVAKIAANPRFEIGNHTVSHPNLKTLSAAAVSSQVNGAATTLTQLSGRPVKLFRPPYGNRNATVDAACKAAGEAIILWDVDTEDWKNRNTATTTSKAVSGARAGSIILMHDIHPSTAAAVPGIITQLRAKGFVLVTVSELLGGTAPGTAYMRRG